MNREEYYTAIQQYQEDYLEHHGIKGQKWGIRRYQNPDGTLTPDGQRRYLKDVTKGNFYKKIYGSSERYDKMRKVGTGFAVASGVANAAVNYRNFPGDKKSKALIAGAGLLGTAAGIAIGNRLSKSISRKIKLAETHSMDKWYELTGVKNKSATSKKVEKVVTKTKGMTLQQMQNNWNSQEQNRIFNDNVNIFNQQHMYMR